MGQPQQVQQPRGIVLGKGLSWDMGAAPGRETKTHPDSQGLSTGREEGDIPLFLPPLETPL